jgi:hypothetical protein
MLGGFDDPLTLTDPPIAKGLFAWDRCYLMGAFIVQSDPGKYADTQGVDGRPVRDLAAFRALGRADPEERDENDPDGAKGDFIWKLELQRDPGSTREHLDTGRALATMVALVGMKDGTVKLEQWCQAIELRN